MSLLLAALLFLPASKLIWTMSVRRLERKLERKLNDEETAGQLQRARFLAFFLVVIFGFLFQYRIFGIAQ